LASCNGLSTRNASSKPNDRLPPIASHVFFRCADGCPGPIRPRYAVRWGALSAFRFVALIAAIVTNTASQASASSKKKNNKKKKNTNNNPSNATKSKSEVDVIGGKDGAGEVEDQDEPSTPGLVRTICPRLFTHRL